MAEPSNFSSSTMTKSIIAAVVLGAVFVALSGLGKGGKPVVADESADARIQPVAKFELVISTAAAGPKTPDAIYNGACGACHGTGVSGAPKKGNAGDWAPRLKAGIDALVKSAIAGKGAMPPKGGMPDLTEAEIKAVIEFMSK